MDLEKKIVSVWFKSELGGEERSGEVVTQAVKLLLWWQLHGFEMLSYTLERRMRKREERFLAGYPKRNCSLLIAKVVQNCCHSVLKM